ncbi:MAG: PEP-CTERM sorting domain-containing protein [Phycisphaerae bacterium]|nr:PEP-CTERM sorting domain-containing protein [Phycisphaerae bacterium]
MTLRKCYIRVAALMIALVLIGSPRAGATDKFWKTVNRTGNWLQATKWDPNGVPQAGDRVFLEQGGLANITVTYDSNIFPSPVLNSLRINATGKGAFLLNQPNWTLKSALEYVGYSSKGRHTQGGGTNVVSGVLYLGYNVGGRGIYDLSGAGSLQAPAEHVGYDGGGTFNQSGGSNDVSSLYLGYANTGSGTYNLDGGDLLAANEYVGRDGDGAFFHTAGTNTVTDLDIGYGTTGDGAYTMNGGNLSASTIDIGLQGIGAFTHSGGVSTVSGKVTVGSAGGSSYTLSGAGRIEAGSMSVSDQGVFTQSGGENVLTTSLVVSGGGSYNLSGSGDVECADLTVRSGMTQSGGTNTVSDTLVLQGGGTYDLGAGSFTGAIGRVCDGEFTHSGGSMEITGRFSVGYGFENSGGYDLSGTGSLTVSEMLVGDIGIGTVTQSAGTNNVSDLWISFSASSRGTYELSGTGDLNTDAVIVGRIGEGTFTQTGGTHDVLGNAIVGSSGHGTYVQSNGTHTVGGDLKLATGSGKLGKYTLAGGVLSVLGDITDGEGSSTFNAEGGALNVSGSITVDNFNVGDGVTGSHTISSGSILAKNENVGKDGAGTLTHEGGVNEVTGTLRVGTADGVGQYVLRGTGVLTPDTVDVGSVGIGATGSGTFTHSGGTNSARLLYLGKDAGSDGVYDLSGTGSLSAASEYVGLNGEGVFNQTGGDNTVSGRLTLAFSSGSSGAYTLSSGTLDVGASIVGGDGASRLNVDGGTLLVGGASVSVNTFGVGVEPGSNHDYTYNGASYSLSADTIVAGDSGAGTFSHTGDTLSIADLSIGVNGGAAGTVTIDGGDMTVTHAIAGGDGSSTINVHSGSINFGPISASIDTFNITGGAVDHATASLTAGAMTVDGGTVSGGVGTMVVGTLSVGKTAGTNATYDMPTHDLSVDDFYVGQSGTGEFTHSGGDNAVSGVLSVGHGVGADGTYTLSGSGGDLTAGSEYIGRDGVGEFAQSSFTTNTISGDLYVGHGENGIGTYAFSGNIGSISAANMFIGYEGSGSFTQHGTYVATGLYSNTVTNSMFVGYFQTSDGAFSMTGYGSLSASNEYVGYAGTGTFMQNGSNTNTITGNLLLGFTSDGVGAYELRNGELSAANEYIGVFGRGEFTHVRDDNTVSGTVYIASETGGRGTYNLQGGNLIASNIVNNDTFNFSSGTLTANITNNATVALSGYGTRTVVGDVVNEGSFLLTNTKADFTGTFTNRGALISDPSTSTFADLIVATSGYLTGGAGDKFYITNNFINTSTQNSSWDTDESLLGFTSGSDTSHDLYLPGDDRGGVFDGAVDNFAWGELSIASGNTLNLLDGDLSGGGALYVGVLEGIDFTDLQVNNITGNGLNIYYAPLEPDNAYLGGLTYDLINGGQIIPLVEADTPGDTNGDHMVDDIDYHNLIAQFGGAPGADSADFNGDNRVDLTDFSIMRKHFGLGVPAAPDVGLESTTPEPTTLSLVAFGSLLALRRKRRKQ